MNAGTYLTGHARAPSTSFAVPTSTRPQRDAVRQQLVSLGIPSNRVTPALQVYLQRAGLRWALGSELCRCMQDSSFATVARLLSELKADTKRI